MCAWIKSQHNFFPGPGLMDSSVHWQFKLIGFDIHVILKSYIFKFCQSQQKQRNYSVTTHFAIV